MSQPPLARATARHEAAGRVQVSLWLTPTLRQALRLEALAREEPYGRLIRRILQEWLDRHATAGRTERRA